MWLGGLVGAQLPDEVEVLAAREAGDVGAPGGASAGAGEESGAASRRLVAYLLQSFRADSAAALPPPVRLALGWLHEH